MDSEQEKSVTENTSNEDIKAETDDHDNNDDNQEHIDHGVNSSSSPKSSSDSDPKPDIKDEQNPADLNHQTSSPLPPDLRKFSEEIDRYISSLLNSQDNESTLHDVPISIEQFLVLVEDKIEDYDFGDSPVKWSRLTEEDSASFLESVSRVTYLSKALSNFSSEYKYAYSINRAGGVLQRAMSYLEEEFKSLLEDYKIHDPDPSNLGPTEASNFGYSEEILSDLIRLSKAMIDGGYETECSQVYYVVRRNSLEENLQKLGLEKHSADDVHRMSWESLEREMELQIKKFKNFANLHLFIERKLSDTLFPDHPWTAERLFVSLSRCVTVQFLNFAEAVALTRRSAEKLFKLLDTYEAVRDVMAKVDSLMKQGPCTKLKNEAAMIRSHLGEAMILIFNELENSIKADSGKNPVPGGAVHPLTRYIMNYLECTAFYNKSLEQVFMENHKIERADPASGSEVNHSSDSQNANKESAMKRSLSPFQAQIQKIMDLLDANIEAKSRLYKDPSLSSIFMMNNGRFTLKKIKRSNELNCLLGETWYRKKSSDLRQYHKGYQRETWGKLLSCLNPEGLTVNGKVVKPVLKERFKSFNAMFDEIHKAQSNWVIADEQLQSELRVSISNMVIPAYRSFLARYSQVFTPGRQTEKYVKYQPEEIEASIDELFSGTAAPVGKKKQKE